MKKRKAFAAILGAFQRQLRAYRSYVSRKTWTSLSVSISRSGFRRIACSIADKDSEESTIVYGGGCVGGVINGLNCLNRFFSSATGFEDGTAKKVQVGEAVCWKSSVVSFVSELLPCSKKISRPRSHATLQCVDVK